MSLSSANAKRSRFGGSNGSPDGGNEELYMSQGKCSACNTTGGSTYTCLKCHKLFHEHCGAFRVDGENSGICGACLTSVICFWLFFNRSFWNALVVINEVLKVFMD